MSESAGCENCEQMPSAAPDGPAMGCIVCGRAVRKPPRFDRRCVTCRWWTRMVEDGDYGQCLAILPDLGCDRDDVAFMAVPDCSQYPHFTTRADFGCVLWEPHDTEGTA